MSFNPNEHMMPLKGKDYLQVAWRLVWFREEHPDWCLSTEIIEHDPEHAIFRCVICDETGVQKSCGHGSESKRDFGDFLEKAETKAVGRALAMLGYGTQFAADELDEGERIVDSPIDRGAQAKEPHPSQPAAVPPSPEGKANRPNQAQIDALVNLMTPEQAAAMRKKYGEKLEGMTLATWQAAVKKLKAAAES